MQASTPPARRDVGLGTLTNKLGLIGAVSMEMQAKQIGKLADMPGLIVTVDEPIRPHGDYSSKHLWPYEAGMNKLWDGPQAPTIAIVDSGIDTSRLDFENRVLEQVDLVSSGNPNSARRRTRARHLRGRHRRRRGTRPRRRRAEREARLAST